MIEADTNRLVTLADKSDVMKPSSIAYLSFNQSHPDTIYQKMHTTTFKVFQSN